MAYSRIRFEIQNSATMTLVHTLMSEPVKNGLAVFEGASAPFFLAF